MYGSDRQLPLSKDFISSPEWIRLFLKNVLYVFNRGNKILSFYHYFWNLGDVCLAVRGIRECQWFLPENKTLHVRHLHNRQINLNPFWSTAVYDWVHCTLSEGWYIRTYTQRYIIPKHRECERDSAIRRTQGTLHNLPSLKIPLSQTWRSFWTYSKISNAIHKSEKKNIFSFWFQLQERHLTYVSKSILVSHYASRCGASQIAT